MLSGISKAKPVASGVKHALQKMYAVPQRTITLQFSRENVPRPLGQMDVVEMPSMKQLVIHVGRMGVAVQAMGTVEALPPIVHLPMAVRAAALCPAIRSQAPHLQLKSR